MRYILVSVYKLLGNAKKNPFELSDMLQELVAEVISSHGHKCGGGGPLVSLQLGDETIDKLGRK